MKILRLSKFTCLDVLIVLVIIVLLFALIIWITRPVMDINFKVRLTKFRVGIGREEITKFKKIHGRYPICLDELEQYSANNQKIGFRGIVFKEFCSDQRGNSKECNVLNGKGGWYYNKNSGELRVNVTKPIKHYLKIYLGSLRNEIPADW